MKIIIGNIFAFYATKMGSMDSGETKIDPHWVKDPPWSFNGPWHGPTIHPTWPFIYWLYFCTLCNKNGIKGLWGQNGRSSLLQNLVKLDKSERLMKVVAILMVFDTAWLQCCLLCNNSKAIQSMGTKMPIKTVLGHFHMHNTALEYKKKENFLFPY